MREELSREERFARAERLLTEWIERRETATAPSFASLIGAHVDLAAELRELGGHMGLLDQVMADGRARLEAEREIIERIVAGLRGHDFASRYAIEGEVGKGGMGAVLRVMDKQLDRPLAMKVILGQADGARSGKTPDVAPRQLQRFLNEARITSQLDHPGIVPVHDLGVDHEGRVYFTMKLVKGRTLGTVLRLQAEGNAEWSRARVLQIIQRVCEALAYAHERGVVHRDLTPANVMVGDFGEVYVMDWGLARRIGDARSDDAAVGEREGAVVGTPGYMPPEQAAGRIAEIGAHSDVYAIGAMLYHAIAGHPPYRGPGEVNAEREIVARIAHEPPQPLGKRSAPPELLAICERAMARDWGQRYARVGELAADLGAFLERRVVAAYATGTWAEARKWIQRNQALAVALLAVLVTALTGGVVATAYAAEATRRAAEVEKVAAFQQKQLSGIDAPSMGIRIRAAILTAAPESARAHREEALAEVNFTDIALGSLRESIFSPALKTIKKEFVDQPVLQARLLQTLADTLREFGMFDMANDAQTEALEPRRSELGDAHRDTLASIEAMGGLRFLEDRLDDAESLFREAWQGRRRFLGDEDPDTVSSLSSMASVLRAKKELEQAEAFAQEALEKCRRLFGEGDTRTLSALDNLGTLFGERGELVRAEACLREVMDRTERVRGPDDPDTLLAINNLAGVLLKQEKLAEAEDAYRHGLDGHRRAFGDTYWRTRIALDNLRAVLVAQGRPADAEPYARESLEILQRTVGDDHPDTLFAMHDLGSLLADEGKLTEAEQCMRKAVEGRRRRLGPEDRETLISICDLASLQRTRNELEEAEFLYREAIGMALRNRAGESSETATMIDGLGSVLAAQACFDEAEKCYRKGLDIRCKELDEKDWRTLVSVMHVAELLSVTERYSEVLELLVPREADMRSAFAEPRSQELIAYLRCLGQARTKLGEESQLTMAEAELLEAFDLALASPHPTIHELRVSAKALIALYEAWGSAEPNAGHLDQMHEWQDWLATVVEPESIPASAH